MFAETWSSESGSRSEKLTPNTGNACPLRGPEVGPLEGGHLHTRSPLREVLAYLADALSGCHDLLRKSGAIRPRRGASCPHLG